MKKPYLIIVALAVMFCGCSKQAKKEDKKEYKTVIVKLGSQLLKSDYSARLTGKEIVEVRPQVSGTITKICINEGDKVRKGQTLFIIDQAPYQAALKVAVATVKSAEAKLATAKLNLESHQELKQNKIIGGYQVKTSENAVQEAEAALALARAEESNARHNLSYTTVTSPVDGVAGMIPYHVGALVNSSISQPLVTVSDDSEVYAYFSISENQSLELVEQYGSLDKFMEQAPEVTLLMSNGKEYGRRGRISAVSGIVEEGTGAVTLRAVFPNDDHKLQNGGSGKVILPTELKDVIVIPQTATYELQNKVFVYKVVNGVTESTPVEVFRLNNGTEYVVQSGLKSGDEIIAEGAGLVKNGIEIKVKK